MRKLFITLLCCFSLSNLTNAQTDESNKKSDYLENNLIGIQVGLFGADLYHELPISQKATLKTELSLYGGFRTGSHIKTTYYLLPEINIEPKYYYNIDKRQAKGKNIKNNGANYISLSVSYAPDWFAISNTDVKVNNTVTFVPTFGIRRNFAKNFNYEFNAGLGYGFSFGESNNFNGLAIDLGFKIGYDF